MGKAPDISGWGKFQPATEDVPTSIVYASCGTGGSGTTHFGLTMPDPIAVHLFDPAGLKGLITNPIFKGKDIRVIKYYERYNIASLKSLEDRAKAAQDALADFEENWETTKKMARSAMWDKEDMLWEMLRYANNENFKAAPASYYELNMQYRGWFAEAERAGINLQAIRGMKERWGVNAKGSPVGTGEMVPRGQKEVVELVQINLDHRWDEELRQFVVKIANKCRLGNASELLGTEEANMDFLSLVLKVYPEADLEAWGL